MKAWAPGRICLLGDKSDLLGRPVIAAAITRFLNFEFTPSRDGSLHFYYKNNDHRFSRKFDENTPDEFFKFLSQICWRLRDRIRPLSVTTYGDLPIGAGLSSSAACSVGFLRGLNQLFGLRLTVGQIAELAYQVEQRVLAIMCWRMDQSSICFGGMAAVETGDWTKVTRIPMKNLLLVISDSQEPRQAKVILNKTMKLLQETNPAFVGYFERIDAIVMAATRSKPRTSGRSES
jgi:mevalonate kinase